MGWGETPSSRRSKTQVFRFKFQANSISAKRPTLTRLPIASSTSRSTTLAAGLASGIWRLGTSHPAREDTRPTKASPLCYRRYRCCKNPSLSLLGVPCVLGGENLRPLTTEGTADTEFFHNHDSNESDARRGGVAWGVARSRKFSDSSFKPDSLRTRTQPAGRYSYSITRQTPNPHTPTHRSEYEFAPRRILHTRSGIWNLATGNFSSGS